MYLSKFFEFMVVSFVYENKEFDILIVLLGFEVELVYKIVLELKNYGIIVNVILVLVL